MMWPQASVAWCGADAWPAAVADAICARGAEQDAAAIAQQIIDIIKSHLIVDIWSNEVAQNNLRNAIDDYFFDVLRDEKGVDLPVEVLDELELKIMDLARARFAA